MNEEVNQLLSLYISTYQEKHGVKPETNHYRDSFGFAAMLHDYDYEDVEEIIEYYFRTGGDHSTKRLFDSYDELKRAKDKTARDRRDINRLLKETEKRVSDWEQKNADNGK